MGHVTGSYNYNAICDVCGFQYKASELRKRWDGLMVCAADYEQRHPMDFYKVRSDHHQLPYTRNETLPTLYDPYLVPHPESFYPNPLTDIAVNRVDASSGSFKSTTWWTPTTTIVIKGIRWYIHPDQVDQDPSYWRFRVMDYYTRGTGIGSIVPKKRFLPGWNHFLFTDSEIAAQLVNNKDTYKEGQHFQLEMVRHVSNIGTPYWVPGATLFPTYTTNEDGYGSCGWYADPPAVVQRARQYYNAGTYGSIPAGYPILQSTNGGEVIVEPIFEVSTAVDMSGMWDKRYLCDSEWLPSTDAAGIYANKFTCNKTCSVTALRLWADAAAGGSYPSGGELGIMLTDGTPVTSVSVGTLNSYEWNNFSVTPVTLTAGVTYFLYHLVSAGEWVCIQQKGFGSGMGYGTTNFTMFANGWQKIGVVAAEIPDSEQTNTRFGIDIVTT